MRFAPREPGLVVQAADFSAAHSPIERPRFPPEKLLRATMLQLLFGPLGKAGGEEPGVRPVCLFLTLSWDVLRISSDWLRDNADAFKARSNEMARKRPRLELATVRRAVNEPPTRRFAAGCLKRKDKRYGVRL
jgi:hypothetical protein